MLVFSSSLKRFSNFLDRIALSIVPELLLFAATVGCSYLVYMNPKLVMLTRKKSE